MHNAADFFGWAFLLFLRIIQIFGFISSFCGRFLDFGENRVRKNIFHHHSKIRDKSGVVGVEIRDKNRQVRVIPIGVQNRDKLWSPGRV